MSVTSSRSSKRSSSGKSSSTEASYKTARTSQTSSYKSAQSIDTDRSHYKFSSGPRVYASDARSQQSSGKSKGPFYNGENLSFSTSGSMPAGKTRTQWEHKPIIPHQTQSWKKGQAPGAHRSVWTAPNASTFDTMTHDTSAGSSARGFGTFTKGEYVPGKERR
nr:hypothetical protein B0A51_03751 [Rachicladosporium sp. CCFEE 5018]